MKSRLPSEVWDPGMVERVAEAIAASKTKHHRATLDAVNGLADREYREVQGLCGLGGADGVSRYGRIVASPI